MVRILVMMFCKACACDASSTANGYCIPCWDIKQAAWQKRMKFRMDTSGFNMDKLVRLLLTQHWMHECIIHEAYMPPFPHADTRPECQVSYPYRGEKPTFLRHGKGPLQGYFWDVYGSDFHSPELALIAISQAPAPTRIDYVINTHGV